MLGWGEPGTVVNISERHALLLSQDLARKPLSVELLLTLASMENFQPSSLTGSGIRLGSLFYFIIF